MRTRAIHHAQIFMSPCLAALLSGYPFANVWIAIHQRDVRCFAPRQKIDAVFTESHIFQVENDAAALLFRADECFQLGDMLCVELGRLS